MKKNNTLIALFVFILALTLVSSLLDIRLCLFYLLFKIPCPGCGFTRSLFALLKGDIKASLEYNLLTIPIFIYLALFFLYNLLKKEKQEKIKNWLLPKKNFLYFILILIVIVSWIKNIKNPLLY